MAANFFKKEIFTKEQIYSLFIDNIEVINFLLSYNEKLNQKYLFNSKDKKLFNFLFTYYIKYSTLSDIKAILRHKKIFKLLIFKKNLEKFKEKIHIILSKFFQINIFNPSGLCLFFKYKKDNFTKKLYHLIRIYYLNHLLEKESLVNMIRLKLYSCFNDEKHILKIEELNYKMFNNKNIVNISPLEEIIYFLLSFTEEEMPENKIKDFTYIINSVSETIKNLFLFNYNNIILLSNSSLFYRLIELGKISLEIINRIIPLLKIVYKFSFKVDFYLNDLSNQFLLKKGENIERKNNIIISKNKFLEELFGCEKVKIIKNGFVFNDNPNNGLVFNANDSFIFPKENFSIVISFKLMNLSQNYNKSRKYCIFSISEKENFHNTKFVIFVEDKKLKILTKGKTFFSSIDFLN